MPLTKQAKQDLVTKLVKQVGDTKEQVLVGYQGLTVHEIEELRSKLRAEGISFSVVKNTLLDRILTEAKIEGLKPRDSKKPLALVTGNDEVTPVKMLAEFAKGHKKLEMLMGAIDRKPVDATMLKALAAMPTRQEMLGIVVGTIAAPVSGFVRVLGGLPRSLVQVLAAYAKTKS